MASDLDLSRFVRFHLKVMIGNLSPTFHAPELPYQNLVRNLPKAWPNSSLELQSPILGTGDHLALAFRYFSLKAGYIFASDWTTFILSSMSRFPQERYEVDEINSMKKLGLHNDLDKWKK